MPRGNNLPKLDRNALERNRRMYMKDLFSKLAYLIPIQPGPRVCTTTISISISHYSFFLSLFLSFFLSFSLICELMNMSLACMDAYIYIYTIYSRRYMRF